MTCLEGKVENMRHALAILVALCLGIILAGCRSGPGSDCDTCATQEVSASTPNGQAAAAAATGGQRANNAPFVEDTVSPRTNSSVARGAGAATTNSADSEHRAVSSGGAQNLALMNPAVASAQATGGVSLAVSEAAKSVAAARRAYQVAVMDPTTSDARLAFLADEIVRAQEALNAASAASTPNVTHNYNMGGDNTIVGYSRAGNGEGPDTPEATKVLGEAAKSAFTRNEAKAAAAANKPVAPGGASPSSSPAPASGDVPSAPPAGEGR